MKKIGLLIFGLGVLLGLDACGRTVVQDVAANYPGVAVNLTNRMQGYFIEGTNIVFIFDEGLWNVDNPASVEVRGTFTSWKQVPGWSLTRSRRAGVWYLTKPLSAVEVPSNSGQPEFKFVYGSGSWLSAMKTLPAGMTWPDGFNGLNNVILFPGDDPAEIATRRLQATTFRTNYDSDAQMANFREVCSGAIAHRTLYRAYNPVIASKTTLPLENARLAAVRKLLEANKIRAVVNLSDTPAELTAANPYPYYLYMMNGGNVFYANISYSIAYFQSATQSFAKPMAEIARLYRDARRTVSRALQAGHRPDGHRGRDARGVHGFEVERHRGGLPPLQRTGHRRIPQREPPALLAPQYAANRHNRRFRGVERDAGLPQDDRGSYGRGAGQALREAIWEKVGGDCRKSRKGIYSNMREF
jgi:hypothetical protein